MLVQFAITVPDVHHGERGSHVPSDQPGAPQGPNDRYLDATLSAFLKHGVSRTRMVDIAAELRVSRTTAYRVLGSVDHAALSLLHRELRALLSEVTEGLRQASDPNEVVQVCVNALEWVEQHPLFRKIRRDEPRLIGEAIVVQTGPIIDTVTIALAASFRELAKRRVLQVDGIERLVETLVRLGITCVLDPPRLGYGALLGAVLHGPGEGPPAPRTRAGTAGRAPRR